MIHPTCFGSDWKKVNWTAKSDYELTSNYSILNRAFNKANIQQNVPVEALAKGKKVENLKFWQWIMGYWQMNKRQVDEGYDANMVRLKCKNGAAFAKAKAGKPSASNFLRNSRHRRKRPDKLEKVDTSNKSFRPVQALDSPHFKPPSPISTPRNEPKTARSMKEYIWPGQEEDQSFKFSSPNSPLSKHVQSWEKRKADLIKSAENNARYPSPRSQRTGAYAQQQRFHDNGNNKFVPQNFLQPFLVQQGQNSQPTSNSYDGTYESGSNLQGMDQQQYYQHKQNVTASVNVDVNGVPHVHYNYGGYSSQDSAQGYVPYNPEYQQNQFYHQNYQSQNQQPSSYTSSNSSSYYNKGIAPYRSSLPRGNEAFNIDININTNEDYASEELDPQLNVLNQYTNNTFTEHSEQHIPNEKFMASNKVSNDIKADLPVGGNGRKKSPRKRRTANNQTKKSNPLRAKLVRKPEPQHDKPIPSYMRSTAATRLWKDSTAAEKRKPKEFRTEIY